MDGTAGSGHRPRVAVGTPTYTWENRAVSVLRGHTGQDRPFRGAAPAAGQRALRTLAVTLRVGLFRPVWGAPRVRDNAGVKSPPAKPGAYAVTASKAE